MNSGKYGGMISSRNLLLAGVCALPALAAHAAEYVQNGSFEQNTVSSTTSDHTFQYDSNHSTDAQFKNSISNWSIADGPDVLVQYMNSTSATTNDNENTETPNPAASLPTSFDNVANVSGNVLQPGATQINPDGDGYFVAMDNNANNNPGASSISQTVSGLTVGNTYVLKFDWAGIQLDWQQYPTQESLSVSLGQQTQQTQTVSECSHCFSGWMQTTMTFIADSTDELLNFAAVGGPAGAPPMSLLDGVSLTDAPIAAVPEPANVAMMMAGGLMLGAYVHRRRSAARETSQAC